MAARPWSTASGLPESKRDDPGTNDHRRKRPRVPRPLPKLDFRAMEQCEAIQTRLWLSYPEESVKNVTAFVGATARCGVSTVAANFAAALASNPGANILLITFGERGIPRIAMQREPDLARWLDDKCDVAGPFEGRPSNLHLLSSESLGYAVASVLQSSGFDDFLARARTRFDHVVIDAPPLQDHPETLVLCRKADGVVLVVRAGQTRNQTILWARQQIEDARANLAGVVLNRRKHYIPRWLYKML